MIYRVNTPSRVVGDARASLEYPFIVRRQIDMRETAARSESLDFIRVLTSSWRGREFACLQELSQCSLRTSMNSATIETMFFMFYFFVKSN